MRSVLPSGSLSVLIRAGEEEEEEGLLAQRWSLNLCSKTQIMA